MSFKNSIDKPHITCIIINNKIIINKQYTNTHGIKNRKIFIMQTPNRNFCMLYAIICMLALLSCMPAPAIVGNGRDRSLQQHFDELCRVIHHHNDLYYQKHAPEISDQKYDSLMRELARIEKQHPEWVSPLSPSQNVGSDLDLRQKIFPHRIPMLSIQNTNEERGLRDYDQRIREQLNKAANCRGRSLQYFVEEKIDGVGISLQYENGTLKQALTRGDGTRGNDITELVKNIPLIPRSIGNQTPLFMEIRGEVYMTKAEFSQINGERKRIGKKPFANSRNAAAGSLHLKDPEEIKGRNLRFFAYATGKTSESIANTQESLLKTLERFGFPVDSNGVLCRSIEEAIQAALDMEGNAESLPYEIDGAVIKVNNLKDQQNLAPTLKDQGGMIAYKFTQKLIKTKVKEITFQVGRTGKITPVAILEPVQLDGSVVERVTLHNVRIIQELDIRPGDLIQIQKSGRVIPNIVSVIYNGHESKSRSRTTPSNLAISECPACHFKLAHKNGVLRCDNENCPGRLKAALLYFTGKSQMNIHGLGDSLARKLVQSGIVKTPADLYRLNLETLKQLNGMSKNKARLLLQEIEKSKKQPFSKLLTSFGIPKIGEAKAKQLAHYFEDLETFESTTPGELQLNKEIGNAAAQAVLDFLNQPDTHELLVIFKQAGFE